MAGRPSQAGRFFLFFQRLTFKRTPSKVVTDPEISATEPQSLSN
jgi:hypothetical protein